MRQRLLRPTYYVPGASWKLPHLIITLSVFHRQLSGGAHLSCDESMPQELSCPGFRATLPLPSCVMCRKVTQPLWGANGLAHKGKTLVHRRYLISMKLFLSLLSVIFNFGCTLQSLEELKKILLTELFLQRFAFNWSRVRHGHRHEEFLNTPPGKPKVQPRLRTTCLNWIIQYHRRS